MVRQALLRTGAIGLTAALHLCLTAPAQAQSADEGILAPRSVGRAGTSTVSGDSGTTLLTNPGGMVRRSQPRLLLSASILDRDTSFQSSQEPGSFESPQEASSPEIVSRAAASGAPLIAYHHGNQSGTWVLGALLMSGSSEVSLPSPAVGQPINDVARLYPHRYGGEQWQRQWRRAAVGGALRIGESVGIGVSASLGQIKIRETRRVWAGFDGIDTLREPGQDLKLNPSRDLKLDLRGEDLYNVGASAGLLVAPPELPLEFALAFEFRRGQHFRRGDAAITRTTNSEFPSVQDSDASASLRLPSTYDLRTGVRYLGERVFLEVGAELYYLRKDEPRLWSLRGLEVADESGVMANFEKADALVSKRTHVAMRGAIDYEALEGYLWLTCGYAYRSPSSSRSRQTPSYARLGGHTMAVGLESAYEEFTLSIGYARQLERTRTVDAQQSSVAALNPFDAGTAPANNGRYWQSADQLGFAIETTWQ